METKKFRKYQKKIKWVADVIIEITGEPSVIKEGIQMIRVGGTYILLGAIYPNNHVTLDSSDIITKCLKIVGMHNYHPEHLKTAIDLVLKTKNKYPYKKLVGPNFDFSAKGLEDAFKALDSKQSCSTCLIHGNIRRKDLFTE